MDKDKGGWGAKGRRMLLAKYPMLSVELAMSWHTPVTYLMTHLQPVITQLQKLDHLVKRHHQQTLLQFTTSLSYHHSTFGTKKNVQEFQCLEENLESTAQKPTIMCANDSYAI